MIFIKLIAHRGFHIECPENSLAAFKLAISNPKFLGIELDIRETLDKFFVVNHNATFKGLAIKNTTYNTLKKLGILSFNEVLKLKTNKIILVEIKDFIIDYEALITLINGSDLNIYLMSFYNHHLKKLRSLTKKKIGSLNYYLNYLDSKYYDFICLLNYPLKKYFKEVFIYGIKAYKKHHQSDDVYLIVDKVI